MGTDGGGHRGPEVATDDTPTGDNQQRGTTRSLGQGECSTPIAMCFPLG